MACSKWMVVFLLVALAAVSQSWTTEENEKKERGNKKEENNDKTDWDKELDKYDSVFDKIDIRNRKVNVQNEKLNRPDIADPELYEGDIIMTEKLKNRLAKIVSSPYERNSAFDAIKNGKWTNGVLVYTFASNFPSSYRPVVLAAMRDITKNVPCIKFKRRTTERNYADFIYGGGCYSMIGMQGGRQPISLGNGCGTHGVSIHEIMHALGFYHEQSRRDRDQYITINFNNIRRSAWYNFQKYRLGEASTLDEPYDKESVMHYGNYAFAVNPRTKTITSKANRQETLGQRRGLSKIDVRQLKKYYGCSGGTTTTTGGSGGCKDLYTFCSILKNKGNLCSNAWVHNNCKKTCNHLSCSGPPPTNCKDKDKNCKGWAQSNQYCRMSKGCCNVNSEHYSYMKDGCRVSCNMC